MLPDSPHLECVAGDALRIAGSRVGLEHLIWAYNDGFTAEELALQYRTVTLEQVHGALAYYLANKAAVDEYLRDCTRQADALRIEMQRQPVPDVVQRLRQIAAARQARTAQ